jgi:hypothetical protein
LNILAAHVEADKIPHLYFFPEVVGILAELRKVPIFLREVPNEGQPKAVVEKVKK